MTSKTALVAGSITLSGLALWIACRHGTEPPRTADTSEHVVSLQDYENLKGRHKASLARLKKTERELGRYKSRNQELEQEIASRDPSLAATSSSSADAAEEKAKQEEQVNIDWSAMAKLVSENIGDVGEALQLHREGEPIPEELKVKIGSFVSQLMKYGMQFKALGEFPYHDRKVYSDVTNAFVKEALGFSESQLEQLSLATQVSFDELLGDTDPAELLPIDRHRLKTEMGMRNIADIERIMGDAQWNDEETMRNWEAMKSCREWGDTMFMGAIPTKEYGLDSPNLEGEILADWREYYSLRDDQIEQVRGPASDYVSRAREVLASYGETENDIASLPADLRDRLKAELLEIQQQQERRVGSLLDDSQIEGVQQQRALVRQFDYGQTTRANEPSFFNILKWLMK